MTRPSDGVLAWAALGGAVVIYEMLCVEGELLSEVADRALIAHPYLTRLGIGLVALHLVNAIPPRVDPIHQLAVLMRKGRR